MAKARNSDLLRVAKVTVGDRKVVRHSSVAGQVELAVADGSRRLAAGFTIYNTNLDEDIVIQDSDILDGFSDLTVGATYYLSQSSAGEITSTRPTSGEVQIVGSAASTTELDIDFSFSDQNVPSNAEKAALVGTSGTPDSDNKFVTNSDSRMTNSRAPSGSASGDLSGSYPSPTVAAASGAFAISGVLSPSSIGSNQNDYNPTNLATSNNIRLTSSSNYSITGLVGGSAGRIIVVTNIGAYNITLSHESDSSTAANRFSLRASCDVVLTPNKSIFLHYDAVTGRWRNTGTDDPYGTSANTVCQGNDSRLSDSRTPASHATSHKSGGSDALKLDELAAPTDVTTLNATTGQHGLLPKLGGGTSNFLRADGEWAAPPTTDSNAIHKSTSNEISTLTEKVTPTGADLIIIEDSEASGVKKKVQVGSLPTGGGGEANTASNIGTGGVGVFKTKQGIDLQFKKINAGSAKVTITDDVDNNEVDIDIATGSTSSTVCVGNDSRLSDDRTASGIRSATTVVAVSSAAAPSSGQVLTATSSTAASWQTPIFGSNYYYAESLDVSSTTSTTAVTKVTCTTGTVPAGDYLVSWSCEHKSSSKTIAVHIAVKVDSTTHEDCAMVLNDESLPYYMRSGLLKVTLTNDVHNIYLQHYVNSGGGGGSSMKRARVTIWRVA